MEFEPKFDLPIYQEQNYDGMLRTIEKANRTAEILSKDTDTFVLGIANSGTNLNTIAF